MTDKIFPEDKKPDTIAYHVWDVLHVHRSSGRPQAIDLLALAKITIGNEAKLAAQQAEIARLTRELSRLKEAMHKFLEATIEFRDR